MVIRTDPGPLISSPSMEKPARSAIFLDRDGTINEEIGHLDRPEKLIIYPWSFEAIARVNRSGKLAIVATNQSGIARNYFDELMLERIHTELMQRLESAGAHLDAIYYCPHHPEGEVAAYRLDCECRKPKPGMLTKAAQAFGLDLQSSYVVGDSYRDIALAHNAGARAVLVLTGYGRQHLEQRASWDKQPDFIAENLLEAVAWILDHEAAD